MLIRTLVSKVGRDLLLKAMGVLLFEFEVVLTEVTVWVVMLVEVGQLSAEVSPLHL